MGFYMVDVPPTDKRYNKAIRCTDCGVAGRAKELSGLTDEERKITVEDIKGDDTDSLLARWLAKDILVNPVGWVTLYGKFGTAKTMVAQVVVAELVRQGKFARFAHAKEVEQTFFDKRKGDDDALPTEHWTFNTRVLVLDEIDKVNLRSDWTRECFQHLLDYRYRAARDGNSLTIFTLNKHPEESLPGDIYSRMRDGNFSRPWGAHIPIQMQHMARKLQGQTYTPAIYEFTGEDKRPTAQPFRLRVPYKDDDYDW